MNTTTDPITAARAAALFVSTLSVFDEPTPDEVGRAIAYALLTRGGSRGCAADMAAEYGEHPELAAPRMRWARALVERVYARPALTIDTAALVARCLPVAA
jgi:hypothetical protein